MREFLTGNEAIVKGVLASGAQIMTGYPITPTTEIIHYWAEAVERNKDLKFLQTEDEMSAGFAMIGAILAGKKAFTATAGPGNVLMQDAFSMAENLRLPTVAFINQRGGPSTGTVIYSQQELNLTCFGGNGEGLRIVYSCSGVQEMFDYAIKAFNAAWKWRFPTFVLGDGYQAKTLTEIETYLPQDKHIEMVPAESYLLKENKVVQNIRNTYNLESELNEKLEDHKKAFELAAPKIRESENYQTLNSDLVIFAHGIIAAAARDAVNILRKKGFKVGLFRPITLNPFPTIEAQKAAAGRKKILIIESSMGQFERLVKCHLYGMNISVETLEKPAMGITPDEIVYKVNEIVKENKWSNRGFLGFGS